MAKKKPILVVHRKLGKHKADGLAWTEDRKIEIDERVKGKDYLETVIHEVMHIQNPKWPELRVEGNARELAEILWQQGFRKTDL